MGGQLDHDIVGSLLARSVSVSVPKNGSILAQFLPRLNWLILVRFTSNLRQIGGNQRKPSKNLTNFNFNSNVKRYKKATCAARQAICVGSQTRVKTCLTLINRNGNFMENSRTFYDIYKPLRH